MKDCPKELPASCPIHTFLEILTRPWTMHILWALGSSGPLRFGELRRRVEGISSRVLTERLRSLESRRFIYRHYEATIPPAVTYGMTKRMEDIDKVFKQLAIVAAKWESEDSGDGPERGQVKHSAARRSRGTAPVKSPVPAQA